MKPNPKKNTTDLSLMDELAAIRDGDCMWCKMHIKHPRYSLCRGRKARPKRRKG